ncbi:portal protein [Dongia sp.]|uniref:portal protein n=1 Tax=Dongia sp. TaxID=1977262 RepID=UPI0035B028FA
MTHQDSKQLDHTLARDLIRRQESLAAERATLDHLWQEIAELMQPMRADFTHLRQPGEKRSQKIFDGTAGQAAENLAAGLWGLITNAANDWFTLRADLAEEEEAQETKLWLDEVTRRMRASFAGNGQRFYARVMELYADLVTFGTGVFYVEEDAETGRAHYSCRHLAECFVAENARDEIDTVFRRFQFTARQAVARWGEACHPAIQRALEKEPDRRFTFLHAVMPRDEAGPQKRGTAMAFASQYVDVEHGQLLSDGGYHEFPYQVPRWSTGSRGIYGDSPAMLALPDVKMLNAMSKTTIIAAQKAVDPPLLAIDEIAVRGLRTHPGGIIYGGLDENGRRRYEPLQSGGNIGLGLELEEQRRDAVRQAFYFSLLMMVQQPNQTATEVLARQEEKLRLMGPHLGRIQAEFLDPLIRRQFGIMRRGGQLPPPPRQLRERGIRIDCVSPLARAQRAGEGAAIVRALESLAPIGAIKPEIYDNIDADAAARALAQSFGAPNILLRTKAAVEELRAAEKDAAPAMPGGDAAGGDLLGNLGAMLGGNAA